MNVEKLREARTLYEANGILTKLGANGSIRKNVETYFITQDSPDKHTRDYGISCLNEAVTTLKDSEQPATPESPGLKTKGDSFVKEEVLDNHNSEQRAAGSEQSTDNTAPYPQEGTKDGDEDMTKAPDTEDQMKEMAPSMMPQPGMTENFGLHPDIAKQMGKQMPEIPAMTSNDQMKQMQYTVQEALKPYRAHMKVQDEAIKKLSQQIKETNIQHRGLSLENALAANRGIHETTPVPQPIPGTPVHNTTFDLNEKRNRMIQINDMMSQKHR